MELGDVSQATNVVIHQEEEELPAKRAVTQNLAYGERSCLEWDSMAGRADDFETYLKYKASHAEFMPFNVIGMPVDSKEY